MKKLLTASFLSLALSVSILGCKKDKDTTPDPEPAPSAPTSRVVKYEITGNYTGKLNVVYTNATGANESISGVTMPWSKEVTVTKTGPIAVGFTAGTQGGPGAAGVPGQTGTIRLYANGVEKQNATQTADSYGTITFGALSHVFN